jgi:hypothetical protein
MTRRITYRKQHRFIFGFGFGEGFCAPGIPIHWIVRVLQKIGTGFMNETVGEFWRLICLHDCFF